MNEECTWRYCTGQALAQEHSADFELVPGEGAEDTEAAVGETDEALMPLIQYFIHPEIF